MPDRPTPLFPGGEDGDDSNRPHRALDQDDAPTPPRGRGRTKPDDDVTPPRGTRSRSGPASDDGDEPNYLMRRIALAGAGLAMVAVIVFVARTLFGGGDDDTRASDPSSWQSVVVLSENAVSVRDRESGAQDAIYPLGADALDLQSVVIANTLITLDADGQVARTDLTDGRDETGQTARDQTLIVAPDNPNFALVVSDIGGDVTVVDVERDQTASVADLTETDGELIFADGVRINPSGSHVGVAIPQLFQSFVVDLETSESTALAGRVMAIGDDRVVTEQPAGDQAEIEFYALDGERLGSVDVQAPKASLITTDGSMLLIANDGTIVRADPDDAKDVGELTDPDGRQIEIIDGTGAADGERLIASTENSVFIVDDSGEQIAMFAGRVGVPPTLSSRCLVLATGTSTIGVTVVDLETGEVVAEVDRGFVTATSTDGCTVATSGISPQIIRDGIVDDVDADAIVAVAPDGAAYATITGRRTSLISGDNDPVELASKPALIRFGYE